MFTDGKIRNLWLLQFFADFTAIVAAYYTTLLIRFHSSLGERFFTLANQLLQTRSTGALDDMFEDFYIVSAPRIIFRLTIVLCVLYAIHDLYPERKLLKKRPIAWHIAVSNLTAIIIFFTYFYLQRNIFHPRGFFLTVIFLNIFYCIWFRGLIDKALRAIRSRFSIDQVRALLIGTNNEADLLNDLISTTHPHGISVVDRIPCDANDAGFIMLMTKLEENVRRSGADMVIVADNRLSVTQIMRMLQVADKLNLSAKILSEKLGVLTNQARLPIDTIRGIPLVHFEAPSRAGGTLKAGNKLLSIIMAYFALALFLPFMALIALLIRVTSHGPALFVQERIGVNRKPFLMYKFRTMHDKAEELQTQIEEFNESGDGLFKIRKDPRVTLIGRFLRRFSLDELPQLINVIRGEMTIVGPRPLPWRDFKNYYEEWHYSRHEGPPGLTCLWQVSGRSDIDFLNMCILDVYYLKNRNWILDLKILIRTAWVVLFAKGAY